MRIKHTEVNIKKTHLLQVLLQNVGSHCSVSREQKTRSFSNKVNVVVTRQAAKLGLKALGNVARGLSTNHSLLLCLFHPSREGRLRGKKTSA